MKGRRGLKEDKIPVVVLTERGGRSIFFVAPGRVKRGFCARPLEEIC